MRMLFKTGQSSFETRWQVQEGDADDPEKAESALI